MPGAGSAPKLVCARSFPWRRSSRLPQHDAFRDLAGVDHAPERDEQLAREARRSSSVLTTPLAPSIRFLHHCARALSGLELQQAPGELDHAASHPGVAGTWRVPSLVVSTRFRRASLSVPRSAPTARRSRRLRESTSCTSMISRVDANSDDPGQHPHHRVRAGLLAPAPDVPAAPARSP